MKTAGKSDSLGVATFALLWLILALMLGQMVLTGQGFERTERHCRCLELEP